MEFVKELDISVLLDLYGALLTSKQAAVMDMYYNLDYSLSEIAQNQGISRQAALDAIRRSVEKLKTWERALGLKRRYEETEQALREMEQLSARMPEAEKLRIQIERVRRAWEDIDGI